ncbi:MAG: metallophosphoesterase [Anaerolineae bacterium]|nr:metallophosphoesterase [Anaerolineae bacterium]
MSRSGRRLDALVVADVHYVDQADHVCPLAWRKCALGRVLLERAYRALRAQGVAIDVAILMGDAVDNGRAAVAERDLAAVAEMMRSWGAPLLAVPGNHDGDAGRFAATMGCAPGLHEVAGYGFLVYADRVGEGEVTVRPAQGLRLPGEVAAAHPDLPLVALQHTVLYPPIESTYPYVLDNCEAAMRSYVDADIMLSLSGHYHAGQAPCALDGVTYYTAPALCEAPHPFAHLRLEGRRTTVWEYVAVNGEDGDE